MQTKMAVMGPMNTKGFTTQVLSGKLPDPDHITYTGTFNQIDFQIGAKTQKVADLHIGFGRAANPHSSEDKSINEFLAIFAKGAADGAIRDKRILNSVIILDVSGSMNGGLQHGNHLRLMKMMRSPKIRKVVESSRLELAQQAIKMFISKLQPNDTFALVTFQTTAQTVINSIKKSDMEPQAAFQFVNGIKANGATTLLAGFNEGVKIMKQTMKSIGKDAHNYENRLIMLTDVEDNSIETTNKFIEQVSKQGIHTTIIGISSFFKSNICQKLVETKGFNYFCATEQDDLKKYLFQNFDWTFFPSATDLEITLESQNVKYFDVFGSPDADKVKQYNNFIKKDLTTFVISKTPTVFPSQLIYVSNTVHTKGGLFLVKLSPQNSLDHFKGKVILKYKTIKGESKTQQYHLDYNFPKNRNFFSDKCLQKAISAFYYVHEIKSLIKTINNHSEGPFFKEKYIDSLVKLKAIAPQGKSQEVDSMIKILQEMKM